MSGLKAPGRVTELPQGGQTLYLRRPDTSEREAVRAIQDEVFAKRAENDGKGRTPPEMQERLAVEAVRVCLRSKANQGSSEPELDYEGALAFIVESCEENEGVHFMMTPLVAACFNKCMLGDLSALANLGKVASRLTSQMAGKPA